MSDFEETQNQNETSDELKFAIPEKGYGVYLKGILPEDQRVLAGAFSTSMMQIKGVEQVQIEKFAQAAYSNENMFGLNLVNGTDVPTDVRLARISQDVCAVGGGVYGTFTMSNFYGAMSGLPYPLRQIYQLIQELQTDNLATIYQNLYLAIDWEQAQPFVTAYGYIEPNGSGYDYQYEVESVDQGVFGGGYGRDGAAAPTSYTYTLYYNDPDSLLSVTSIAADTEYAIVSLGDTDWNAIGYYGIPEVGGIFVATGSGIGSGTVRERVAQIIDPSALNNVPTLNINMDDDPNNVPGNYGKLSITTNPFTQQVITFLTSSNDIGPEALNLKISLLVDPPPGEDPQGPDPDNQLYNDIIDQYILAANNEILNITTSSPTNFQKSNMLNTYWDITGKALKQEQRARYISTAPVPVPWDKWLATYPQSQYIFVDSLPTLAANTLPHMYVQTLEHISDLDFTGGQSIVGLMRESRNEERLNRAGLVLDINLRNDYTPQDKTTLITNNTLPGAIDGINGFTIPSFTEQTVPVSYYDPCTGALLCYNETLYVESDPIASILGSPSGELNDPPFDELPETPFGYEEPPGPEILPSGSDVVVPDTSFPCEGTRVEPAFGASPSPVATSIIGVGEAVLCNPPVDYPIGINQPPEIIPPELDAELIASTTLPSAPTVAQAIDQVIKCNCDCWVA
jgi:hypothetical protein